MAELVSSLHCIAQFIPTTWRRQHWTYIVLSIDVFVTLSILLKWRYTDPIWSDWWPNQIRSDRVDTATLRSSYDWVFWTVQTLDSDWRRSFKIVPVWRFGIAHRHDSIIDLIQLICSDYITNISPIVADFHSDWIGWCQWPPLMDE